MTDPRIAGAQPINAQSLQALQAAVNSEELQWVESDEDFDQWCDLNAFNPMAMMRRFRPVEEFIEVHHEATLKKDLFNIKDCGNKAIVSELDAMDSIKKLYSSHGAPSQIIDSIDRGIASYKHRLAL